MNFSPHVKAWITLVTIVISTGGGLGLTSFLGGSSWQVALIVGLVAAATNVGHALNKSPQEKKSKDRP